MSFATFLTSHHVIPKSQVPQPTIGGPLDSINAFLNTETSTQTRDPCSSHRATLNSTDPSVSYESRLDTSEELQRSRTAPSTGSLPVCEVHRAAKGYWKQHVIGMESYRTFNIWASNAAQNTGGRERLDANGTAHYNRPSEVKQSSCNIERPANSNAYQSSDELQIIRFPQLEFNSKRSHRNTSMGSETMRETPIYRTPQSLYPFFASRMEEGRMMHQAAKRAEINRISVPQIPHSEPLNTILATSQDLIGSQEQFHLSPKHSVDLTGTEPPPSTIAVPLNKSIPSPEISNRFSSAQLTRTSEGSGRQEETRSKKGFTQKHYIRNNEMQALWSSAKNTSERTVEPCTPIGARAGNDLHSNNRRPEELFAGKRPAGEQITSLSDNFGAKRLCTDSAAERVMKGQEKQPYNESQITPQMPAPKQTIPNHMALHLTAPPHLEPRRAVSQCTTPRRTAPQNRLSQPMPMTPQHYYIDAHLSVDYEALAHEESEPKAKKLE